ncbi:RNA-binding protein [Candidatus Woesearchaeota archaeon]|nr:RNA-binding protein [Candidatus Woesearchaeota archaeon]
MSGIICLSCKKRIANIRGSARFMCPSCSKYEIIRCTSCRAMATRYKCPECQFSGPN